MSTPINNLRELLRSMTPERNEGIYCFATMTGECAIPLSEIVATIREKEGLSLIVSQETARQYGLSAQFECAWITLCVHSDLAAVGLTAAFATALGNAGISCNVVAGNYHDHLFVPYHQAENAMETLRALQKANA